ncbi:MAG TPA: hypothetical protein VGL78_10275 [Solirubrobacteraceae bacterium]
MPEPARKLFLSAAFWRLFPTLASLYVNWDRVREPMKMPSLPTTDWSRRERRALLDSSEERLRSLEGKGPGLAAVSAVIVAAVLVAITSGWNESTAPARVILALAAVYAAFSLLMPLYLVGPLRRDALHVAELDAAAQTDDPEEALAKEAGDAAMNNDLRNLRLSNLLDAARRELSYTLLLLLLWALLVPATSFLRHNDGGHPHVHPQRTRHRD